MKVCKPDSLLRQLVDVRSLYLSPKCANIRKSQVISDNDQKVGTPTHRCRRRVLPHDDQVVNTLDEVLKSGQQKD